MSQHFNFFNFYFFTLQQRVLSLWKWKWPVVKTDNSARATRNTQQSLSGTANPASPRVTRGNPVLTSRCVMPFFFFLPQAVDSRDSVAMALYSQCFSWIILKINQKIKGKDNFKCIGILDIFGFENFEVINAKRGVRTALT